MLYSKFFLCSFGSACLAFAAEAFGASSVIAESRTQNNLSAVKAADDKQILLAKKGDSKRPAASKRSGAAAGRERNIVRERTYRGEQRKLDFEAVDIRGERDNPLGTQLGQTRANKEFDLIKIRLRWHPEMIQSTSSLETGRSN